mgnify:CR=1 FL=1
MKLSQNDLFLLSQCAISAALQAGQVIKQHTNSQPKINIKPGGSTLASQVVTEVDHFSQAVILQHLNPTCTQFDLALLTEESPDDQQRLEKDFFWCIDPLDGTLPFIESSPGYSVSIALVSRQGVPYIGVVYDPVKQTLYHAIKGLGIFRNATPWQIANTQTDLTFITDRSFIKQPLYEEVISQLNKLVKASGYSKLNIVQHGGAAMNACWVLEQGPACYFKFPKQQAGGGSLWDFAATACLFNETQAQVSDIAGLDLDLNRPDSTFMNHRGVLYSSNIELAQHISALYKKLS